LKQNYVEGNKSFRSAVSAALDDFVNAANRFEKGIVVQRVVDMVHSRGGRFLKEDNRAGSWYQLSEQQSKEKVGHAIRDAANLYEVRKKKEQQMQELVQQDDNTPQLKRTGSDEDGNKKSGWWATYDADDTSQQYTATSSKRSQSKSYRPSQAPSTEYAIDYSASAAKRRGSMAPPQATEYEPERKRRRTLSPSQAQSYFHSTMALSDNILATPSPRYDDPFFATSLRRSPIINRTTATGSNVVSSEGSQKSSIGGGIMTSLSSRLKRSPIDSNILPPVLPKQPSASSSRQYYHQFTVYDPRQQSETVGEHPPFHSDVDSDYLYSSPLEATTMPHPLAEDERKPPSRSSRYPYGRSDFAQSSKRSSYEDRQYQSLPHHYGPQPYAAAAATSEILPPMGHLFPYPQQYTHQQQPRRSSHGSGSVRGYEPHSYYAPQQQQLPPPYSRGSMSTSRSSVTDLEELYESVERTDASVPTLEQVAENDDDDVAGEDGNNATSNAAAP
jgi:hypothetical protein